MKSTLTCKLLLAFTALRLAASTSISQEALRISLADEAAAAARRQALEQQSGNIQLGHGTFLVGAALGLEYNDNVNYSDRPRQEDVIIGPGLNLTGSVPLSEVNAVYLSLDLGYSKYLHYSQYDRLLVAPGSQLGFDIYIKDFHFNLHDQVSVTQNPVAQGTISGVGVYDEFANTAGLAVDWDLTDLVASFGFDHQNAISTTSYFAYLDRSVDSFFGRASFQLGQTLTTGPEATFGLTDYDKPLLNNNVNYSIDFYADWQASDHLRVKPRIGYTLYSFDALPSRRAPPDADSYFFSLQVTHQLNDFIGISIDAGRRLSLGVNADLLDIWYLRPVVSLKIFEKMTLQAHLVFEQGTDIGNSFLVQNEQYTLLGGGLSASYQLMTKVLLSLEYDYAAKSSDILLRNYHQNRISLRLQYTF